MINNDIANAYQEYYMNYGCYPDELFINFSTRDALDHLVRMPTPNGSKVGEMFAKPVYVLHMSKQYMWVGKGELNKARETKLDEEWESRAIPIYVPSIRENETVIRKGDWKEIIIPREIIQFDYS
ncbi:hypothetical protein [Acinetobacter courvalinii]|uniref:hypothetical protein n=1 Tax=Acinetobacter courvalinii TaxID=280147 RepID=UPI0028985A62|nr:hypothetical protein [Acinetobacter courvalinii]